MSIQSDIIDIINDENIPLIRNEVKKECMYCD